MRSLSLEHLCCFRQISNEKRASPQLTPGLSATRKLPVQMANRLFMAQGLHGIYAGGAAGGAVARGDGDGQ